MTVNIDLLILCGGRGSRMGGVDKGLLPYRGQAIVSHLLQAMRAQFAALPAQGWGEFHLGQSWISANRSLASYAEIAAAQQATVVRDLSADFSGPLAGIQAALRHSHAPYLLVLPCDVPELPADLLGAFLHTLQQTQPSPKVLRANSPIGLQPAICLLAHEQRSLIDAQLKKSQRSLQAWQAKAAALDVFFNAPFHNLNRPEHWREMTGTAAGDAP